MVRKNDRRIRDFVGTILTVTIVGGVAVLTLPAIMLTWIGNWIMKGWHKWI